MAAPMRNHVLVKYSNFIINVSKQRCQNVLTIRYLASKAKKVTASKTRDPGPEFIRPDVQSILLRVTGTDTNKIFQPRLTHGVHPPHYKLLTDKQLKELEEETVSKTKSRLQMPPVMKPREDVADTLSDDSEIDGFDTHKIVFTDITTRISHKKRVIVIRETNGVLRHAKPSERDRILQCYYPSPGRLMYAPKFLEAQNLEVMLQNSKYEYVLDTACVQFEPDDPEFIRVTQRTYEHIASNNAFDMLRSTRYFGCMAFHLAWYNKMETLLANLVDTGRDDDAQDMIQLFCLLHPESKTATTITADMPLKTAIRTFLKSDAKNPPPLEQALAKLEAKSAPKPPAKKSPKASTRKSV